MAVFPTSTSLTFAAFCNHSGMGFDTVTTQAWNSHNRGKLWQDIRDKAAAEGEADE